ncbi:Sel1 repeat protein [Variibacter gotjawalensis]|uniref:Sel1 repeat protein n=1 Tax=Variibacter gotjawalensis TaxID=1333996 RepID=A0A0S3PWM9_9BRAD|nr:tetratricopeptide repeat protein [Variibacter gotjawalensis]NIK46161.1 hypothetical protein [Variibacter gotjawalensis]RZS48079.1 hypothetical protein EV661_0474 [Variibacter gotjawalensis]BAT60335.1 Sel1 repeat protein [Variibacter gotjawalensis]
MRIFSPIALAAVIGAALVAPAMALDPARPQSPALAMPSPTEAFRKGAQALRAGDMRTGVTALEYAAEQGQIGAQWKLGRMYQDGDQIPKDDIRAFNYFSRIANSHAEDSPDSPQSRFVANAFVALGNYYLEGIPNSPVKADSSRAREMFWYAASYFRDRDAQYNLGRIYLEGNGAQRDPRQAIRWLNAAAEKGQNQAQATLGHLLFKGEQVPRQAARGLMWLILAKDGANADRWVTDLYEAAVRQASDDERQLARVYLERYMKDRRE